MGKQPACLALATASLLVISSGALRAQALAPSALDIASHDQKTANDMVQVSSDKPEQAITKKRAPAIAKKRTQPVKKEPAQTIAKESAQATAKEPVRATAKESARVAAKKTARVITKEPARVTTKEPAQVSAKEPVRAAAKEPARAATKSARAFGFEPVRAIEKPETSEIPRLREPVARYSFKNREGKKESVSVITQYYPKRIVYPYAKIDRHIDSRLMQAATIAQERAHAHSRSRCWHYVKDALLASGVIDSRPRTALAREAARELVSHYGFKRLSVTDPFAAPVGAVLVYGTNRTTGHVEIRTRDGFVSDFRSRTPSRRPLLGVYAKL